MKIAFCGAHGTGKSTLIRHPYWQERFPDHRIVESTSRNYKNGWSGREIQREINYHILWHHWRDENFISARSYIDPWAYSRVTGLDTKLDFWYFLLATRYINYDFLFYLPIQINLVDDGFRPTNPEYQRRIDAEIKLILDFFRMPYFPILGTVKQRIETIANIIDECVES